MPSLKHITWERVEREGSVIYPARRSRRARQRNHLHVRLPDRATAAAASFRPTCCRPTRCRTQEYPLVLTTGRLLEHWHTGAMTRRAGVLDAIEPQGIAAMNPYEIERRGLRSAT